MRAQELLDIDKTIKIITPAELAGVAFSSISKVQDIRSGTVCFIKNMKVFKDFRDSIEDRDVTGLGLIIARDFYEKDKFELSDEINNKIALISTTESFDLCMCDLSKKFYDEINFEKHEATDGRQLGSTNIHPTALISQNVFIGENVSIGPNVKILPGSVIMSDVSIAEDCYIYPNVTIYRDTTIGKNTIIHAGAVVGSDGFGYHMIDGVHKKIWHIGGVKIGDDVEIGPNSAIDRGTFGDTVIEDGVKLDNMVHVAHNCHLNKGVLICAQSGLAGSVTLGKYTFISGNVGVAPGVVVEDECQIGGKSGVLGNLKRGSKVAGHPARPINEWLRSVATIRKISKKD